MGFCLLEPIKLLNLIQHFEHGCRRFEADKCHVLIDINTKCLWNILSEYECRNSVHADGDEGFHYTTWISCMMLEFVPSWRDLYITGAAFTLLHSASCGTRYASACAIHSFEDYLISHSTFRLLMQRQPTKYTIDESPDYEKLLQAGCSIRRRFPPWTMTMGHPLWKVESASPIAEDSNGDEDELKQEKAPRAGWHSRVLPGPMAERLCGITDHIPI